MGSTISALRIISIGSIAIIPLNDSYTGFPG
jgi:hypothetical protein